MNTQIPTYLQSSVDSTKISLTIESIGKTLAGVVAMFAAIKGIDPVIAQAAWGGFVGNATTFAVSAYTAYHAAQVVYGLLRKAYIKLFVNKTVTPVVPVEIVSTQV